MKNTITSEKLDDRLLRDIFLELVPDLPPAAASSLGSGSEPRHYDAGDLIIGEGEPSTGIFLLTSGTVQSAVSKRTPEAIRHVSLHQIAAPAVLGLTAAMLAQPSAVSVLALTPTETEFIPRADFLRVLGQFPQAGLAFSQVIAGELAQTYSHLSQLRGGPGSPAAFIPAH
jgi:CRP-like cAMP-binding protein